MFGSFAEMKSNVKDFMDTAVEYAVDHLRVSMAAMTPEVVRTTLRRRFKAHLSMAAWRGYANLIFDRTKYLGIGVLGTNRAQIKQGMRDRVDAGEYIGVWAAHETDVPSRDVFPTSWGDS
jgi:hypothetical protein